MAWSAPRTWVVGEIVTAALMNTHVRDDLRYLKGLDGVPTVESGLTIDNTDGDERLLLPLLSTAEIGTVLNAAGEVAYDEQTNQIKAYDGTAVRVLISEADVDDTPVNGATTVPVSSNWAYDHLNLLTTAGDLAYATAAGVWARLALGAAGQRLRVNAGATAPEWAATGQTMEFFVPYGYPSNGAAEGATGDFSKMGLAATQAVYFSFRMPADFAALTSAKISLIPTGTGTYDWTVTTDFAAAGEAYNTNSDSATADGVAGTTAVIQELDVGAALTGLAANDNVGLLFTLDALATITAIAIIGLNIKYT